MRWKRACVDRRRRPTGRLWRSGLAVVARGGRAGGCVRRVRPALGEALTVYSGQHVQTTQALVARLREADGHHGQRAHRRRGRPGRPDRDRGLALAGRRLLHRELAAAAVPGLQGSAGAGRSVHAGQHARRVQLAGRQVGRRLGPGERHGLQHVAAQPEPAADVGHGAGRAAVEGQDRHRRRRDRLPADRHVHRPHLRRRGRAAVARGGQGERRQPHYPDNETLVREVNRGQVALGVINQYYWYREQAAGRRGRTCTRPSPTSRRTTPGTWSMSRAPAS